MRRSALLCAALALATLAVGVVSRAPTAQTTSPEACRSDSGPIRAAALPETFDLENCRIGGKVITDNGVRTDLPEPGRGVYVEALTTEGAQELEVTRYRDGTVELEHVGDEAEEARAASPSLSTDARRRRLGECRDPAYTDYNWRVTGDLDYSFDRSGTPPELTRDAAEGAINSAGTNITRTRNNCRLADGVKADLAYLGDADSPPGTNFGLCDGDGRNVVFFGDLAAGTLAVTCYEFADDSAADYDVLTESDIKINKADFKWTVNPGSRSCRNRYDLQAIMTHEWGHTFGLGHVSQSRHANLTMSPYASPCQSSERTLGRGDVLGLNRKYSEP